VAGRSAIKFDRPTTNTELDALSLTMAFGATLIGNVADVPSVATRVRDAAVLKTVLKQPWSQIHVAPSLATMGLASFPAP
jgi:hypothetical protein